VTVYESAGDYSLSDVGGTLGSCTRPTVADDLEKNFPAMAHPESGSIIFSDDSSFEEVYEGVCDILLDVYSPAGKLG
jgi:hypothetical protein